MSDVMRRDRYARIRKQLTELLPQTQEPLTHRATVAAVLHHKIPKVSWTGFYMLHDGDLIVDAYQGPLACQVLTAGRGVCWLAMERKTTVVVGDVQSFPGHVACDARSRSEIVVPIFGPDGEPVGVLDVDSHELDHFDEIDEEGYESVVRMLEERWNGAGKP